MEHVVFFPAPDGAPVFRRVPSLEEAVRLVEHLRNVEGVGEVAVHPLGAEVQLAFRAYYRVEVPAAPAEPAAPLEAAPVAAVAAVPPAAAAEPVVPAQAEPAADPVVEPWSDPVPALADAGAKPSDGVKSLGFFA